jgi:hypothetical protein
VAQRHHDLTEPAAGPSPALGSAAAAGAPTGEALAGYLRAQATDFLRALRLHRETGGTAGSAGESVDAVRALRRTARRISGSLHTFRPLLDPAWSEQIRPELAWLSGTLAMEHAYGARLERLLLALHRLSGATVVPTQSSGPTTTGSTAAGSSAAGSSAAGSRAAGTTGIPPLERSREWGRVGAAAAPGNAGHTTHSPAARPARTHSAAPALAPTADRGSLTVGAAKAGALLDRQLTLARTRAHSTALQALGSSRFHAVADKVAVLASEVPLTPAAPTTDLRPLAAAAEERFTDAVAALPLVTAGSPYNAEALVHGLSPDPAPHPQDAPWHQVRLLLRLHRYACEVLHGQIGPGEVPHGLADHGQVPHGLADYGEAPHAEVGHGPVTPVDVRLITAGQALDRHRDAAEAAAAAAQAARTPRIAPATAYALGVLHADQRHEVEAARYAFQRCWQKETIGKP